MRSGVTLRVFVCWKVMSGRAGRVRFRGRCGDPAVDFAQVGDEFALRRGGEGPAEPGGAGGGRLDDGVLFVTAGRAGTVSRSAERSGRAKPFSLGRWVVSRSVFLSVCVGWAITGGRFLAVGAGGVVACR